MGIMDGPFRCFGELFGYIRVPEKNVGVVHNGNKFVVLEPGDHFVPWFRGYTVFGIGPLAISYASVPCEIITKDNILASVVTNIQCQATLETAFRAYAYEGIGDKKSHLKQPILKTIRSMVREMTLVDAFNKENELAEAARAEIETVVPALGYKLQRVYVAVVEGSLAENNLIPDRLSFYGY